LTVRLVLLTCALLAVMCARAAPPPPPDRSLIDAGAAIYLRGVLPSGAPLEGVEPRLGLQLHAADAACVNCHQRSGLGSRDSGSGIPPVTGEDLFRQRVSLAHQPAVLELEGLHGERAAYTDATLARAIRTGIDSESRPFSELMPRFELDDSSTAALIAYLKQLTPRNPPGVTGGLLHLATVVTPDSDPVRRRGVLDVLEHYVAEKNAAELKSTPGHTERIGLARLRWQLHVWQLTGPAATWRAQLERYFASDRVFALLSGVGTAQWQPVHEFCERHAVPCFFPNLEVPVVAEQDFYSVYFSEGVLLEAELIARSIRAASAGKGPIAVYQVYRSADSGAAAAAALATALKDSDISVSGEAVPAAAGSRRLGEALSRRPATAIVVLWLRSGDLAAITGSSPPPPGRVYVSGLMSGLEHASLPPRWREHVALSYPVELPQRRRVQLDYAVGWFAFRHIPIVDLQAQADTFLACTLLGDTLKLMATHASSAYLIEQLQALLEHRTLTGYYPRLALGAHQHFASKGGYIVHFDAPQGATVAADTPWLVP
jgi:mono/diheme cytochrome c family protein